MSTADPPLVVETRDGLFCPDGGFHIDPWGRVDMAICTHAHSDHARPGSARYLIASEGATVFAHRLPAARFETMPYGEGRRVGGVTVSLHPAGHCLGSAQVRIERGGRVWVVSGDYKLDDDGVSTPFEPVPCHRFISECTFGLPVYRWPAQGTVHDAIGAWWAECRRDGRTAIVGVYALGKAQRILRHLDPDEGPILVHGAIAPLVEAHRAAGVALPPVEHATVEAAKAARGRAIVLAPPSALATAWTRRFGPVATAAASGWMRVRGVRGRHGVDRGFVLSDHADWPGLLRAIDATGCSEVGLTHGFVEAMARFERERGRETAIYSTRFVGDAASDDASDHAAEESA